MSITKEEVYKKVRAVVVEQLGVSDDEVTEEASYTEDLGADSLDTVELVMALEEEFSTEIADDEAEKLTTVGKTVDYVLNSLNQSIMSNRVVITGVGTINSLGQNVPEYTDSLKKGVCGIDNITHFDTEG